MVHGRRDRLFRWESALLFGIGLSLLAGLRLAGQQKALAEKLVRLHVVAASDSREDQETKLAVRDAVLRQAEPWLEQAQSQEQAMEILAQHLPELAQAGAEVPGVAGQVTASLEEDAWFPTKEYTDFSLPAGRYPALRITLGAGEGHNWWCVVYPELCGDGIAETVAQRGEGLSQDQIALITGETEEYEIRFRALELWDRVARWFEDV